MATLHPWKRRVFIDTEFSNLEAPVLVTRALNRAKVLHYLASGIRTRKQLHYKNSDVGDWCRENDAAWFDEVLPPIPQSQRKGVGRRKGSKNKKKGVCVMPIRP